ncbi:MAG: ribonuclease P protein component [Planctomycetota bacterium]
MIQTFHFRRRHRLAADRDYQAVFAASIKQHRGPITVFARENALPHHRLGLSIGKRIGGAVIRVRLKRKLREAFRMNQHLVELTQSGGFDFVVTARPHKIMQTTDYNELLTSAMLKLARKAGTQASGS